jgi:hypothetical protein
MGESPQGISDITTPTETEAEEPTDGESAPVADAQLEECPQGKVKCPFCEECTTAERTTCDNCGLDRDEGSSGGE